VLFVAGEPVWGVDTEDEQPDPLEWNWADLLALLARAWPWLALEEQYPFDLTLRDPRGLRDAAEQRWADSSKQVRSREQEQLYRFLRRHDLSEGLGGVILPSVMLMREGQQMWLATENRSERFELGRVLGCLEAIGNGIAQRLRGAEDAQAGSIVAVWEGRQARMQKRRVTIQSGLDARTLEAVQGDRPANEFWEVDEGSLDDTELLAVARSSGGELSLDQKQSVLERVRASTRSDAGELDALSREARGQLANWSTREDFKQGHELAVWLRERLGLATDERAEPHDLLQSWGIPVEELALSKSIEALGVWGPRHGPALFVNPEGLRSASMHGRRATLAHEICHLLVDRERALPMAEVLGGASPSRPERRANAFAAELLLPQSAAARVVQSEDSIRAALDRLCTDFGVGQQLAAWQILNGPAGEKLTPDGYRYVDACARARSFD